MKKKLAKDILILVNECIAGLVLLALVIVLKPGADFTRGLFIGFGSVLIAIIALIVVRRIAGGRRFGEVDEREARLAGKAAGIAIFVTVIGLALFVILAASLPAVRAVSSTALAVTVVLVVVGVYQIGAAILKRLA